jgi:hypothetical protein
MLSSCGSDDEPESGLYNWRITKSVYNTEGGKRECINRWNEYLYDKSEEYVKIEKINFEKKTTKYNAYVYAYHKMN